MNVFITDLAAFLPGPPISNQELDAYLIGADRISAKTRKIILQNNGITTRHYALEPGTGRLTHSNRELTAEAVRALCAQGRCSLEQIACLSCGTASPDQLMPGHASMVHGELGAAPCEINTASGICLSGIMAMKYGAMAVAMGLADNAVATGSDLSSSFLRPSFLKPPPSREVESDNKRHPAFSFEADFLRWMLSDGAGAMLLEKQPTADGISLRIDWLEIISQAHRQETCMYAGGVKEENGAVRGWRQYGNIEKALAQGAFAVKQDARLLNREVIKTLVGDSLPPLLARHGLKAEEIDWFLPHYSSEYFRAPLHDQLAAIDFPLPYEKWFTNLATRGNTGAASFYIMLQELFASGRLRTGEKIFCFIPESGRFAVGYILLTVV
ncbi:beta-ketoacyl-ACP synthase III [Desulfurivibrio dismutans]|uniref:beta-ketoacyl-ACP synthase III n=1 Tax=Desulfurivibrio dismutans TaxID=1398908 RepID=UPI003D65AEBC